MAVTDKRVLRQMPFMKKKMIISHIISLWSQQFPIFLVHCRIWSHTKDNHKQEHTYKVWIARRGEKVPFAMVWSLLSYKERRFKLCRSWKASTRRQLILLAFSNLFNRRQLQNWKNSLSVTAASAFFTENFLCAFVIWTRDVETTINWQWHKAF